MKHLLTILVLLSHINTSMFIPVLDEKDQFDSKGRQLDDINSVAQYIKDVLIDHGKGRHKDTDDDQAHYFVIANCNYYIFQQVKILEPESASFDHSKNYCGYIESSFKEHSPEHLSPPPKHIA